MSNPVTLAFLMIAAVFAVVLVIKSHLPRRACAICLGVSITWITLLILYWRGQFPHPVLLGVLMGQSIVGLYYLLEKKLPEAMHVFRLPYLLSATALSLLALRMTIPASAVWLIIVLWFIMGFLYTYRRDARVRRIFERVIACCKNW